MRVLSVCYNVSAYVTEHRFENLTPGSKYNISLAAVTGAGAGPQVIRIVNTLPENNMTGNGLKRRQICTCKHAALKQPSHSVTNTPSFTPRLVLLWVLSLLFVTFLISTMCTCMLRQ